MAPALGVDEVRDSRGVAVADLDGDGLLDLAINNNDASPSIYLNRSPRGRHWLAVQLEGRRSNRDAVGARVRISVNGALLTRQVEAGAGYASQAPKILHFGLGQTERIDRLEVSWPGGGKTLLGEGDPRLEEVDRRLLLVEPSAG